MNKVDGNYCVSDNTLIVDITDNVDLDFIYHYLINLDLNKILDLVYTNYRGQLKELLIFTTLIKLSKLPSPAPFRRRWRSSERKYVTESGELKEEARSCKKRSYRKQEIRHCCQENLSQQPSPKELITLPTFNVVLHGNHIKTLWDDLMRLSYCTLLLFRQVTEKDLLGWTTAALYHLRWGFPGSF